VALPNVKTDISDQMAMALIMIMGIVESSTSKKAVLLGLIPSLCFVNIGSAFALWIQAFVFGGLSTHA